MERDISIDIVKFFAVFLIINSHADVMYPHMSMLATGGAIGDCLFLFASGFTLFLGDIKPFSIYYKRRINRIYPSVIVSVLMMHLITHNTSVGINEFLGGEFIEAIMVYYVILWLIRYFDFNLRITIILSLLFSVLVYIFFFPYKYETGYKGIYGITTYFRWIPFFSFMLLGAIVGKVKERLKYNIIYDSVSFLICLIVFYAIQLFSKLYPFIAPYQIVTIFPLLGIVYFLYKIFNYQVFLDIYKTKYGNKIVLLVSGICLESYLTHSIFLTDRLNNIWPLNLLLIFLIIIAFSYFVRCLARFFLQTFQKEDYNWSSIISI